MSLTDRFGGRRALQVGVLTVALLIVLAFLAADTLGRAQDTRSVWVMTRSAVAGGPLDAASWHEERIPVAHDPYSFIATPPTGKFATHSLSPGDILRQDDVESAPRVSVPVKLGGYQPIGGDLIDIYAVDGGKAMLVGRGITVINASTIEVAASDEPLWIALFGNSTTLLSARSNGTGVPDSASTTAADAVKRLATLAQGGGAPVP